MNELAGKIDALCVRLAEIRKQAEDLNVRSNTQDILEIEMSIMKLRGMITHLEDKFAFFDFQFAKPSFKEPCTTKYVVCVREKTLYFLLGKDEADGHGMIVQRHGFKPEACLGGGVMICDPATGNDGEISIFRLDGESTQFGANRVKGKTENALVQFFPEWAMC